MSRVITGEELLKALFRLRVVAKNRIPPLGFKRGQAVGPEDKDARLTLLHWLTVVVPGSLLHRLLKSVNPAALISVHRIFNSFLDDRINFEDTMEEFYQLAWTESGHEATALEWCTMSILLDDALFMQNSASLLAG